MTINTGYGQYEESLGVSYERHRTGGMLKIHTIVAEDALICRRGRVIGAESFNGLEPSAGFGAGVDLK
jgi:hypothetical protein